MRNLIVHAHNTEEAKRFLSPVNKRGQGSEATSVVNRVSEIIESVRTGGDDSLLHWARTLDGFSGSPRDLEIGKAASKTAWESLPIELQQALSFARERVHRYHTKIRESMRDLLPSREMGGFRWTPIERVGIYVPGGTATYPSTVLMTATVARVAGVRELCVVTPAGPKGISPVVLGACHISGVDRIFPVGGVHALAALAFGTRSVPEVDQIVGPGNRYVSEAKRQLFGKIAIDMIAGPTEVVIVADAKANPTWIASDLIAQAEHDIFASAILITDSQTLAKQVQKETEDQLQDLPRREIAEQSLEKFGSIVVVSSLNGSQEIVDWLAPEHLELCLENSREYARLVRNAGAIFFGETIPEAAGDYCFGPSHVLPTNGSARFSSPISVETFMKRTSLLGFPGETEKGHGSCIEEEERILEVSEILARAEGLEGHARSAHLRRMRTQDR
ncbi:MAG: histidinol dehydrogenase [Nitrospirota bacterium]|nr:histidinol dehydrogenase [Nitrospirota bacterium]